MADILTLKRGDTWRAVFSYKDSDGNPIDLTGCTPRIQVRTKRRGGLLLSLDLTDGLTLDELAGTVTVRYDLPSDFELGTHEFDIEMTYTDGTIESSCTMMLAVLEDITRAS